MIRPATAEDRQLVRELRSEFEREVPDELWDDDDADYEWDYVLLADDVGVAALDRKGDRTWLLDLLYVRPAARSRGLGTELVRAAAEYVHQQGAEMLALEVLESNADAKRMYDRLGFRTVERTLAAPAASLAGANSEGPTFGFVHVQTDDIEKVKRDAAKMLRLEPEVEIGTGWVRVRSDVTDAEPEKLKALAKELSYTSARRPARCRRPLRPLRPRLRHRRVPVGSGILRAAGSRRCVCAGSERNGGRAPHGRRSETRAGGGADSGLPE